MLRRSNKIHSFNGGESRDDSVASLLKNLRDGVEALKDPEIERKVQSYFERHPNYSRDMIHVAAVACGFQAAKRRAGAVTQSQQATKGISPSI